MCYQQDYSHPSLGTGFGPGFKVIGGYDLVGNEYVPGEWMICACGKSSISVWLHAGYTDPVPDEVCGIILSRLLLTPQ